MPYLIMILLLIFALNSEARPNLKKLPPKNSQTTTTQSTAPQTDEDVFLRTVESVKAGITAFNIKAKNEGSDIKYPEKLDNNFNGECESCFSAVIATPVSNGKWTKGGDTYKFTTSSFEGEFDYDPDSGIVTVTKSAFK